MENNYLTYYQLLEIETNATTEQVIFAYKEKVKKFHPDKNNGSEVSSEMFRYLTQAKEWLSDPIKRKQYDELIGISPKPTPNPKIVYLPQNTNQNSDLAGAAIVAGLFGLLVGVVLSENKK